MFEQIRARSGAALAAMLLMLSASAGRSPAAEVADFAGSWDAEITVNVEVNEAAQTVTTLPARLDLERTGVTMGGTLAVTTADGDTTIPLEGATFSGDRLMVQIQFTNEAGDASFEALMKPLFGDLGLEAGGASVQFKGWLESKENKLTGRIDAEGFSMPGVMDSLFLDVAGTKTAGPGVEVAEGGDVDAEPGAESPADEEGEAGEASAAGGETDAEGSEELPALEQYQGEGGPALSETEEAPAEDDQALHAGSEAEVTALETEDLADQEVAVQMSAARVIAEQERQRRERAEAMRKLDRVHTFEYVMEGATIREVVSEASVRALVTTAARLYYGNYVLIGRDLLEPYLRQRGAEFLVQQKILAQEATPDGRRRARVEITVDTDALYDDLESKHFIAEPNFRPVMAVALEETLNDEPTPVSLARATLEELLRQVDMRVKDEPMGQDLAGRDVFTDEALLRAGREEAQRLGADILVTGSVHMYGPESRVILFDQFYKVDGELVLRFVRADNNQVLRTFTTTYSASAPTAEEAIETCIFQMGADAVVAMTKDFLDEWQMTMLDKTQYRVCLTGADEKTVDVFEGELRKLSPEVEVYRKSMYADVAVLNFNLPGAEREQVEDFLRRHRLPQFKVIPTNRGHYELRVL